VLSDAYLKSETAARTAAHHQALQGKERALIPVLVSACDVPPLLAPVIAIDLTEVDEDEARRRQRSSDRARIDYVKHFYRADARDPRHYHMVLDSTAVAMPTCVDLIVTAARAHAPA